MMFARRPTTLRETLGCALPPHYPAGPEDEQDVAKGSPLPMGTLLESICKADQSLVTQVRRHRGSWLVSSVDDKDNKIICCSKAMLERGDFKPSDILGKNLKHLQAPPKMPEATLSCNQRANAILREAFKRHEDVHVVLLNYSGKGVPYGNSLCVITLRSEDGKPMFRFAMTKEVSTSVATGFNPIRRFGGAAYRS